MRLVGIGLWFLVGVARVADGQQRTVSDSGVFEAVVQAARARSADTTLLVNPVPVPGEEGLGVPEGEILEARRAILRRLILPESGDVSSMSRRCVGVLLPARDRREADSLRSSCPPRPVHVIAIGVPRAGVAVTRDGMYDPATRSAAPGLVAVRVVRTEYAPGGSMIDYYDYVLRCDSGKWVVAKTVLLIQVH